MKPTDDDIKQAKNLLLSGFIRREIKKILESAESQGLLAALLKPKGGAQ